MAEFVSADLKTLTTTPTVVYTSQSDSTIVLSLLVANTEGSQTQDVTVSHIKDGYICGEIAHTIPVPNDASLELLANKYVLPSGNQLKASSSASGFLSLVGSIVII